MGIAATAVPQSILRDAWSWQLDLKARNLSPNTISGYLLSIRTFDGWLGDDDGTVRTAHVSRDHVREFLIFERGRDSSTTANTRYKALRPFFKWCVAEGLIDATAVQAA